MSVHELVMEIYYAGAEIKSDVRQMCEDALRKAVIREDVIHCGECRYGKWETQEPFGKGEGIACHVIAGRSRPWLGAVTDYCSEGRRKVTP
jgi:hypothetical protein